MTTKSMHFERRYEFGASILWDALVDADLVSGWLAEAVITPRLGGRYDLHWFTRPSLTRPSLTRPSLTRPSLTRPWLDPASMAPCTGRITAFEPFERLSIEIEPCGVLDFRLREVAGGSRGTSTVLSVDIGATHTGVAAARVRADWLTSLDQLAGLLRGHPVDWKNWERDHAQDWAEHFTESENEARRQ